MAKVWNDYVNGGDFGIFVGASLIAAAIDNQISMTRNMIRVSNKDTAKAELYRPGRGDGTVSGSARILYNENYGFSDLFGVYKAGTEVTIKYSNNETGDKYIEVKAFLSELSRQDPDDDNSTVNYSFQFNDEPVEKTVAT